MVNRVALDIFDPATPSNLAVLETAMLWKFWKLCRISLAKETVGYEYRLIREAKNFFDNQILINDPKNKSLKILDGIDLDPKSTLFSYF
jgi:hypothetical protein